MDFLLQAAYRCDEQSTKDFAPEKTVHAKGNRKHPMNPKHIQSVKA
jgi:hypothetical protein